MILAASSAESHKNNSGLNQHYNHSAGNTKLLPPQLMVTSNDSASDFLSVASNYTQQNAELTDELMIQAELLRSPTDLSPQA